jgi:phosphatidylglycerophosphate synthase
MKINHVRLWKEGKYIDMWSIPHILCGFVFAGIFNYLGIGLWLNLILSILIMIWWEFFELIFLDVHEYFTNKTMDILMGLAGFFIMYALILKFGIKTIFPWLIVIVVIWLLLNYWGFYAHKTRVDSKNIIS